MMNKKTGMTPTIPAEDLSGGRVLGAIPVSLVLVKYVDGQHGKEVARLAVAIPGGEIYFLNNNSLDMRPAQQWLKSGVQARLASRTSDTSQMVPLVEDPSQV